MLPPKDPKYYQALFILSSIKFQHKFECVLKTGLLQTQGYNPIVLYAHLYLVFYTVTALIYSYNLHCLNNVDNSCRVYLICLKINCPTYYMFIQEEKSELDIKDLWKRVLAELQITINPSSYNMFFGNTYPGKIENNEIALICLNGFVKENIEKKFFSLVQESVNRIGKGNFKISFTIKDRLKEQQEPAKAGPLFENMPSQQTPRSAISVSKESYTKSNLTPKFTFETYIMGKNNQLAFAIASAVAQNPGKVYNPFFLYAGVGLGKTHLIHAIGNRILEEKPGLKVIYTTGESFTNELIEAIKSGRGGGRYTSYDFRDKFRKADVLLIDDIQFIAGKETTQEEFFHTFNALYMTQKQIVITSDRPPKDFKKIEERITSRFESGITADIQAPDEEMRSAILRKKRDENQDAVSNNVLDFIAEKIDTNVRELEGAYLQVLTYAKAFGGDVSVETAAKALGQKIKSETNKAINLNQILKTVCNYYSVKTADIKGPRRNKELVIPRQITMYLIQELTKTPLVSIGEFLGGRDHTTIMHGVGKIEKDILNQDKMREDVINIRKELSA